MSAHPINLAVRFLLEVSALISSGVWGWYQSELWPRYLLAVAIPLALATIWGVFAVPNDPSRSGKAPVTTSGIPRLLIELAIFVFAVWMLYDLDYFGWSLTFGLITLIHYALSYDRVQWLLRQ